MPVLHRLPFHLDKTFSAPVRSIDMLDNSDPELELLVLGCLGQQLAFQRLGAQVHESTFDILRPRQTRHAEELVVVSFLLNSGSVVILR